MSLTMGTGAHYNPVKRARAHLRSYLDAVESGDHKRALGHARYLATLAAEHPSNPEIAALAEQAAHG